MYLSGQSARRYDIAELKPYAWKILEEDLVNWWLTQSIRSENLMTTDGEAVIVIDAGQRNDGPGPDIRNCRLILDDREIAGSVEMHLKAGDWYQHGHDLNPAFSDVILHVVKENKGGPNLSTLVIADHDPNRKPCLARRPIQHFELMQIALDRFQRKVAHVKVLSNTINDDSTLLLGMVETILAGPQRSRQLQVVALKMGLPAWPDSRKWQGSYQVYPRKQNLLPILDKIFVNAQLFRPAMWGSLPAEDWAIWDNLLKPIRQLGISKNHGREWVVNILAPYYGLTKGFKLWQEMPIFRHYGLEKTIIPKLGVNQVNQIFTQQAVLEWSERVCARADCTLCPLIHSHHGLD